MNESNISVFLEFIKRGQGSEFFNPWRQSNHDDAARNGPQARIDRLRTHVSRPASLILVGEAPSYQGCRISGIPFTAEKHLLDGIVPGVPLLGRASTRERPWSEPSGTIVWRTLYSLGLAEETVLWNAFPWHPFPAGNPMKNRTPTLDELERGFDAVRALLDAHPAAKVVAVGKKSEEALALLKVPATTVRHPANGGATQFADQLALATGRTPMAPA